MNFEITDEQRMWRKAVHEFCAQEVKPMAAELDAASEFNTEAFRKMVPLGLLGMEIPEEYGGPGIDTMSAAIALEELGMVCGGTALSVLCPEPSCRRGSRCRWREERSCVRGPPVVPLPQ